MVDIAFLNDVVVPITAVVGAGLGLFNFFKERSKESVKIRVTPRAVMSYGHDENGKEALLLSTGGFDPSRLSDYLAIEVVNLSSFAVTLDSAGFVLKGTKQKMGIYDPAARSGKDWPKRLEPREVITLHARLSDMFASDRLGSIKYAYAKTACGHIATGTSPALKELVNFGNSRHNMHLQRTSQKTPRR